MSPALASRHLCLAASAAALAVTIGLSTPARALDPARDPVVLEEQPAIGRLKVDLLWQRARLERREARERGRERGAGMRPRNERRPGQILRPAGTDEDAARGPAAIPAERAGVSATLAIPANLKLNDKTGDSPYACQSEPGFAMLGSRGLAAWNDGEAMFSGGDSQGAGITADGGTSWSRVGLPRPPGAPAQYWLSDPVVAVDHKTADFYYAAVTAGSGSGSNGLALARGTFSAATLDWDTVRVVRVAGASALLFDKPWLWADSSSGRLHLTYTTFGSSGSDSILYQSSSDRGRTWTAPRTINASGFGKVQGSRVATGPGGEIWVVWQELGSWAADALKCRRSTDGGATFGTVSTVASIYGDFGSGAPGFNRPQGLNFPSLAVDRSGGSHRGRAWVAWNESVNFYDDPLGGGGSKSEVENNNWFSRATPFTPGQKLRGTLSTQLDLDYFSFAAAQGQTFIFYCDSLDKKLTYYMRVFCGADTGTRLAFGGSPFDRGKTGLIVWTAPTTATYYLRMAPNDTVGKYRIQTGVDSPSAGERARDHRDAFVSWSDGGASWSTPVRVNDDPAGLDDWLPEVAVTIEGYPYAMWYDWRDSPASCFGQSNVYTTRSTDGGLSWAANQRVTSATTAWSYVAANIAPNQGDYLALCGGAELAWVWGDGRLGDADVWMAVTGVRGSTGCPPDSTWLPGTEHVLSFALANPNLVFANTYTATLSSERAWPGLPATAAPVAVPAEGSAPAVFPLTVPDTARAGLNRLTLLLRQANGVRLDSSTVVITIPDWVAVAPRGRDPLALRGAWPNPAGRDLRVAFTLPGGAPAVLEILDLAGRRVAVREVGSLGPGSHLADLGREARALRPGVYALRLVQGGRSASAKIAIVR